VQSLWLKHSLHAEQMRGVWSNLRLQACPEAHTLQQNISLNCHESEQLTQSRHILTESTLDTEKQTEQSGQEQSCILLLEDVLEIEDFILCVPGTMSVDGGCWLIRYKKGPFCSQLKNQNSQSARAAFGELYLTPCTYIFTGEGRNFSSATATLQAMQSCCCNSATLSPGCAV